MVKVHMPQLDLTRVEFPEKLQCLFSNKRYIVLYGGRGAGRSWGVARALLALSTVQPLNVLCARELQNSIDESVHKVLSTQIAKLNVADLFEVQRDHIYGPGGTSFSYIGIKNNANKVRSFEGIDICWVEEANKVSKNSWQILIPTVRKKGSKIIITFNPELESDYTYVRFVKEEKKNAREVKNDAGETLWWETDDTIICKMTYKDNPWFFADTELVPDMEKAKKNDYDEYLNVWEGNPAQVLEGAVYAKELRRAQTEGRICSVPYEREIPVDTFWDLGRADNTAIWFMQRVAMQYRILEYFEICGEDVTTILKELQKKKYLYGTMFLPHDGKHKKLVYKNSIEEIVRNSGYNVIVLPKTPQLDGINAAREMFPNCYFDEEGCEDGLHALRHYKYEIKDGQRSATPKHDEASDGADAFRYMAMARRLPRAKSDLAARLTVKSTAGRTLDRVKQTALGWMG